MNGKPQERRIGSIVAGLRAGVSPVCDMVPPGPDDFGVLTLTAVTTGVVERKYAKRIAPERISASWPVVRKGTVLVTRGNGSRDLVGACVLVEKDEPRLIPPDTAWILEMADGHSARFLVEFLRSARGRKAIHEITRGSSGIWKISQGSFLSLRLPPTAENVEAAVDIVAKHFDKTQRVLTELIDSKRIFRRGFLQRLLTGQSRFPEFVRSNGMQRGEFGAIPKDWTVVPISEIAEEVKTRGAVDGSIVYSCTKYDGLVPSLEYFGKQVFSRNLDSYKRLQTGDFAYATNHIEEGSIGVLREGFSPGLVSPMYTVFRPVGRVNSEFLYALLKTESCRRVFASRMSASVDRRGSLRWKDFSQIKIGLPSVDEQDRITDTLKLLDSETDLLAVLRERIDLQKRALLSRLFSGGLAISS